MAKFDMDAARIARAEAEGGAVDHEITFGGQDFTLPFELPWEAAKKYGDPDVFAAELLGEEQYTEFMKAGPSDKDMLVFAEAVAEFYGFESPGESGASSASSSSNGKQSKPTSNGTTPSTSAKRSSAKRG